jgi:hypothetical protein
MICTKQLSPLNDKSDKELEEMVSNGSLRSLEACYERIKRKRLNVETTKKDTESS